MHPWAFAEKSSAARRCGDARIADACYPGGIGKQGGIAVRVGVIGVGHFGRFHAVKLAVRGALAGVADADPARAAAVAAEVGAPALTVDALIAASDAVVVAAPTRFHAPLALAVIAAGRHVFVEKPLAGTMAEATTIADAASRAGVVLQVGHIERYSAAIAALRASGAGRDAAAYEAIRVAPFRPRSLDVSVVLDLMIHDLDLVLELAASPLETVRAVGAAVASERPDYAVAQLGFASGAIATITASRVSLALDRRLRTIGTAGELRVDFLARTLEAVRAGGAEPVADRPGWGIDRAGWVEHDSLEAEQAAFFASIDTGAPVEADAAMALRALDAALRVEAAIAG